VKHDLHDKAILKWCFSDEPLSVMQGTYQVKNIPSSNLHNGGKKYTNQHSGGGH
jgi:hypothetical protein